MIIEDTHFFLVLTVTKHFLPHFLMPFRSDAITYLNLGTGLKSSMQIKLYKLHSEEVTIFRY